MSRTTSLGRWQRPVLANALFLALAAAQLAWPAGERPAVPATRQTPPASTVVRAEPTDFPAIIERPLFAPNRRPGSTKDNGPSSLDGLTVVGIAVSDQAASAMIRWPAGKIARLRPGQRVEEWRLASIEPMRLQFEKDGEWRTFALEAKKLRPAPNRAKP